MKKIVSAIAGAILLTLTGIANAHTLFEVREGVWELSAWDGAEKYCALTTYWSPSQFLSIRITSEKGMTLVIHDEEIDFEEPNSWLEVALDDISYGEFPGALNPNDPHELRFHIGHDADFFTLMILSDLMFIAWDDYDTAVSLDGLSVLGADFIQCTKATGF